MDEWQEDQPIKTGEKDQPVFAWDEVDVYI